MQKYIYIFITIFLSIIQLVIFEFATYIINNITNLFS